MTVLKFLNFSNKQSKVEFWTEKHLSWQFFLEGNGRSFKTWRAVDVDLYQKSVFVWCYLLKPSPTCQIFAFFTKTITWQDDKTFLSVKFGFSVIRFVKPFLLLKALNPGLKVLEQKFNDTTQFDVRIVGVRGGDSARENFAQDKQHIQWTIMVFICADSLVSFLREFFYSHLKKHIKRKIITQDFGHSKKPIKSNAFIETA